MPEYQELLFSARNLHFGGQGQKAEEAFRQCQQLVEKAIAGFPERSTHHRNLGSALYYLAVIRRDKKEFGEARQLMKQAIAQEKAALQLKPGDWESIQLLYWFEIWGRELGP